MGIQTRFCKIVPAITWSRKNTRKNINPIKTHTFTHTDHKQVHRHAHIAYMKLAHTHSHTHKHLHLTTKHTNTYILQPNTSTHTHTCTYTHTHTYTYSQPHALTPIYLHYVTQENITSHKNIYTYIAYTNNNTHIKIYHKID